jgi:molybdate transport system permease protein
MAKRTHRPSWHWSFVALGSLLVGFLLLPLVSLLATATPNELVSGLLSGSVWPALRLTLKTTFTSLTLVLLFGTPLAWALAHSESRGAHSLETLLELPIVVPPAVAGVALLLTFGRHGLLTGRLYPDSVHLAFTTTAVVVAETFVSAPFYVQAAVSAFRRIDPCLLAVAASLGANPWRIFLRIAVPIALPGLIAGAAMSWARALGEFGATLMFAGNLEGVTQTLPLAIYSALEVDMRAARAISVLLVVVALVVLLGIRARLGQRPDTKEQHVGV